MGVLTFGDNLTDFFHGDILVRMWPDLSPHLPREVRAAWEERLSSDIPSDKISEIRQLP